MSCKREQLSLLKLPSAADIMKSPVAALSPGQRSGETYATINTFGIFVPMAQKCHALKARNPQCHGALPLINAGRSNRKGGALKGSTPVAMYKAHVLWRSAFQAHRSCLAYPGTSYPVTIATLCSAFQALNA